MKRSLFKPVQLLIITIFLSLNFLYAQEKLHIIFSSAIPDITQNKTGNFAELATLVKEQRLQHQTSTIFLFGGNSLGPSPMSSLDKGVHIIDILNSIEPDAMAVNKREFSFFEDELSLRSYEAAFPFILSNIYDRLTNDNIDGLHTNLVLKRAGLQIGVISIIEPKVVEEYATKRVVVKDIKDSIKKQSFQLKEQGADIIILLASNIFKETDELLEEKIIDLSLTKNEYFTLSKKNIEPKHSKNILIKEKNEVALITLDIKNKKVNRVSYELLALNNYKKDIEVLKQITNYTNRLNQLLNEKIGVLKTDINTKRASVRGKENAFGNLISDAIKEYTGSQIAILNGGTIRGDKTYKKNQQLTRRDITKELPYRNEIVLIELKGEEIIDALENGFSMQEKLLGRFPQVSGLKVQYDSSAPIGKRVKKVFINNKPLKKESLYKLATSTYLASGGDGFSMFLGKKHLKYTNPSHRLIADVIIEYIIKNKIVSPKIEGRIKDIK